MKSRAIIHHGGRVNVAVMDLRPIREGEVLVETEYTCISPGTELRCLTNTEAEGSPYIPGYAALGRVVESRSEIPVGTRVFCSGTEDTTCDYRSHWGGQCSHAIRLADTCVAVPEHIDPIEASLTAMGAIAYHGMMQSRPRAGEDVIAVGLGVLGQFAARLHAYAGANVLACDLAPIRVDMSSAAGINSVLVTNTIRAATQEIMPDGATLVIDSTGVPDVISQGIEVAYNLPWTNDPQPPVRYLIQGSYPADFSIPYDDAFRKQLAFLLPRDRQKRDMEVFVTLLAEGAIPCRDLVTRVMKPEDAALAYTALQHPQETPGTIVFDWS